MNTIFRRFTHAIAIIVLIAPLGYLTPARADGADDLNKAADTALKTLYADFPEAVELNGKAKGVLIFPNIIKAGFLIGGQYGEGVLRKDGKTDGYYNSVATSYGLQAGVQSFAYVLFLMTDSALEYLDNSEGFEIGSGPSIVVLDKGAATSFTTTTLNDDIYALTFNQAGLMGGLGLQGTKITKIELR